MSRPILGHSRSAEFGLDRASLLLASAETSSEPPPACNCCGVDNCLTPHCTEVRGLRFRSSACIRAISLLDLHFSSAISIQCRARRRVFKFNCKVLLLGLQQPGTNQGFSLALARSLAILSCCASNISTVQIKNFAGRPQPVTLHPKHP